jgi:hypothetical protein
VHSNCSVSVRTLTSCDTLKSDTTCCNTMHSESPRSERSDSSPSPPVHARSVSGSCAASPAVDALSEGVAGCHALGVAGGFHALGSERSASPALAPALSLSRSPSPAVVRWLRAAPPPPPPERDPPRLLPAAPAALPEAEAGSALSAMQPSCNSGNRGATELQTAAAATELQQSCRLQQQQQSCDGAADCRRRSLQAPLLQLGCISVAAPCTPPGSPRGGEALYTGTEYTRGAREESWGLLALPFATLMASASGTSGGRSKQASTKLYYF